MEFTDFISNALCIKVKASEHITVAAREKADQCQNLWKECHLVLTDQTYAVCFRLHQSRQFQSGDLNKSHKVQRSHLVVQ